MTFTTQLGCDQRIKSHAQQGNGSRYLRNGGTLTLGPEVFIPAWIVRQFPNRVDQDLALTGGIFLEVANGSIVDFGAFVTVGAGGSVLPGTPGANIEVGVYFARA